MKKYEAKFYLTFMVIAKTDAENPIKAETKIQTQLDSLIMGLHRKDIGNGVSISPQGIIFVQMVDCYEPD